MVGKVIDPTGQRTELVVEIDDLDFGAARAAPDQGGYFRLSPLGQGRRRLTINSPPSPPYQVEIELPDGEGEFDVGTVDLSAQEGTEVLVVDAETGRGISSAALYFLSGDTRGLVRRAPDLRPATAATTLTGDDGWALVPSPASADGGLLEVWVDGYLPENRVLTLGALEHSVTIELTPAATLEGTVTDDQGKPIEGAEIIVVDSDQKPALRVQGAWKNPRTDRDGHFRLSPLPNGDLRVMVFKDGFAPAERNLEADGLTLVEFALTEDTVLHGTVRDENGQPVVGARISVNPPSRGRASRFGFETTDLDGYFAVDGLRPGLIHLTMVHEQHGRVEETILVDEGVQRVDLEFPPGPRHRIAGDVVYGGEGVVGVEVILRLRDGTGAARRTVSQLAGHFSFEDLVPGIYVLSIEDSNLVARSGSREIEVRTDIDGIQLGVEPRSSGSGGS